MRIITQFYAGKQLTNFPICGKSDKAIQRAARYKCYNSGGVRRQKGATVGAIKKQKPPECRKHPDGKQKTPVQLRCTTLIVARFLCIVKNRSNNNANL